MWDANSSELSQATKIEGLSKEGVWRDLLGFLVFALGLFFWGGKGCLFVCLVGLVCFFYFGKQCLCVKDGDW